MRSAGAAALQTARKPDSVLDDHSSRRRVAAALEQPTRGFRPFVLPANGSRRSLSAWAHRADTLIAAWREATRSLPIWSCSVWGLPCRRHYCRRGGLLPPLFTLALRFRGTAGRFVFCDTIRRRGLNRDACACLSARAASCPAVSGLSSPNFYRARRYPRLGIKELGATTRPQSYGLERAGIPSGLQAPSNGRDSP